MVSAKKGWTLRSPRDFSRYLRRCVRGASSRRFTRMLKRAEKGSQQHEEALRFGRRAAQAHVKQTRLPNLEREVIVKGVADMGLKTAEAKHIFSAKEYPRLLEATRAYLRTGMVGDEKARDAFFAKVIRICGPKRAETVVREVENARAIVAGWVEEPGD